MRTTRTTRFSLGAAVFVALALLGAMPQAQVPAGTPLVQGLTTPKQEWGKDVGADYFLANYQQLIAYWRKLDKESDRMQVLEIGQTAMKKPQLMAIITAPGNFAKLERYKEISRRLSLAEGLTDDQARALAKEGKAVVWIDGGLHASEVLGAQQLLETVYQLVSRNDEETQRFLNDVIVLCVPANPDGMDLVSDAYMKHTGTTGGHPGLYNYYAGHDNNRDSYMNALPETTNMSKQMYREWYPQIMYNHHQAGPGGSVMFAPPFRDPHNYNFHPMTPANVDLIGSVMATRFIEEGKPGVVSRKGAAYSTWWNGGLRTTAYFHNQIGILTETIGNPTPGSITWSPTFGVSNSSAWWAITPQPVWHFRQSIDYSITANRAVLDFASRYRETLLYRIYQMGKDEIKWGNEDHWTMTPHKVERIQAQVVANPPAAPANAGAPAGSGSGTQAVQGGGAGRAAGGGAGAGGAGAAGGGQGRGGGGRGGGVNGNTLYAALTTKDLRDPRGFIMPSDSPDFGTSIRFVNALIKSGITVHRATSSFTVNGKTYPANSLVIKTAQAFRPHVMDMFEPQDHPDDIPYAGAAPTRPYDNAGYTLAYQMGVQFDRILDAFDGPFEKLTDFAKPPAGIIKGAQQVAGYYFTHQSNDSFIVLNRLLAANEEVSWLFNGPMGYGTFFVASKPTTRAILQKAATDLGVSFESTATRPTGASARLRKPRVGLFDTYGGGMPSGWTKLLLENFEFPYDVVYPPMLDAGDLRAKYDVLIFNAAGLSAGGGGGRGGGGGAGAAGDAPPAAGGAGRGGDAGGAGAGGNVGGGGGGRGQGGGRGAGAEINPADDRKRPFEPYAEEFTKRQGNVSAATLEKIKEFVAAGGTVIAIDTAAPAAVQLFKLPLKVDGAAQPSTEYYVPGSVLRVAVDPKNPLAHGYGTQADVFFDNSPVFRPDTAGAAAGVEMHSVAWFADNAPLRSGWAWGQKVLDKGIQIVEAQVGKGRVLVFGNDLLFRSQPHGNYRFFFNGIYLSVADGMKAGMQ